MGTTKSQLCPRRPFYLVNDNTQWKAGFSKMTFPPDNSHKIISTACFQVVSKLCRAIEAVLSHGLRPRQGSSSALKQMSDLVSSNLPGFLGPTSQASVSTSGSTPNIWNFIKVHLNRHELERWVSSYADCCSFQTHAMLPPKGNQTCISSCR